MDILDRVVEFLGSLLSPAGTVEKSLPGFVVAALQKPLVRDRVLYEARRNKVLCRSLSILSANHASGLDPKLWAYLAEVLDGYQKRAQKTLELISDAQRVLEEDGVRFCIFKTVPDFPDLNHEIDILIEYEDLAKADGSLRRLEPSEVGVGSWEIPDKKHYLYHRDGEEYEIELYPKFTEFGEDYIPDSEVISRARRVTLQGVDVRCPTVEDELLVICTHTIYRHGGIIKLSDVYSAVRMLREDEPDMAFIYDYAQRLGVAAGLDEFLSFVCEYYMARAGKDIRPSMLHHRVSTRKYRIHDAMPFPHRLHTCKMTSLLAGKVWRDIRRNGLCSGYPSFKTLITKVASRLIYIALKLTRQERGLRWFGWA